ncbi:hypothetical protein GQ54DRAFT_295719 [Martensiomyces pterosporus]|nr:hypothetical protein GQ54DRAFT_295719 [Martensiomyces pterosporus]
MRAGLTQADQEQLKKRLNTSYSAEVLNIARHFGNQPNASSARVLDIDTNGITIEWDFAPSSDKPQTEEMQFAFREVSGPASALQEVSDLASEAYQALGLSDKPQLTRDREAMEARHMVDFTFTIPNPLGMLAIVLGLSLTGYLAYAQNVHPSLSFIKEHVASQGTCYYILAAATGLHIFEACAVYAMCHLIKVFQPRQMDTANQIKWTVGCALFGILCLHDFISRIRRQFALADAINTQPPPQGASANRKKNN